MSTPDGMTERQPASWRRVAPPWLEGRVGIEQLALIADPVFRGAGVTRGNGRPVLLIPGFMAGDWSLGMLASWLRRSGYRPRRSGIVINARSSESTVRALERRLVAIAGPEVGPVTVIGHSRGGVLATVLAKRRPELIDQVITLGSPIAGRATDSTDPDVGGAITAYEFNWGDGTAPEAASTGIAAHTYTAIGTYQVKVKVTDRNGGVTTSDPVSVTVTAAATTGSTGTTGTTGTTTGDTAPPVVAITAPKPAAKLRRDRTIVISGSVSDQTGVRNVLITVRRTRDAKNKRISGCQFWDGVKTLKPASCTSPILIRGLTVDLTWRRTIVGKTLPAGTYEVRVQATDLNGFTTVLTTNARSPVRTFRLIDPPKKTTKKK